LTEAIKICVVEFWLSPKREDPAKNKSKFKIVLKVVLGYTPVCIERAMTAGNGL
jgi:hypothetical protein